MTDDGGPPPRLGPAGCAAMVVAFPAGIALFFMAFTYGAGAAALGITAVTGAFVLVARREPLPRAIGTGILAGLAVALLVAGACTVMVAGVDA